MCGLEVLLKVSIKQTAQTFKLIKRGELFVMGLLSLLSLSLSLVEMVYLCAACGRRRARSPPPGLALAASIPRNPARMPLRRGPSDKIEDRNLTRLPHHRDTCSGAGPARENAWARQGGRRGAGVSGQDLRPWHATMSNGRGALPSAKTLLRCT